MARFVLVLPLLWVTGLMAGLWGCASAPPLSEVREIPVDFESITLAPPPRKLDASVRALIDRYHLVSPSRLACARPHQSLTREEIDRMASGATSDSFVIDAALEEFLNGNCALAVQMAKAAAAQRRRGTRRVVSLSMWAYFLAESGDFRSAEKAIASGGPDLIDPSGIDPLSRPLDGFSSHFALASMANARGDALTARDHYFNALKAAQTVPLRSAGRWREGIVQIGLARSFVWSGHLLAAENWIREAVGLLHFYSVGGTMTREYRLLPHGLITYSDILFDQGRFEEAETTALCALNMLLDQCVPTDSLARARARQTLAKALMALNRWQDALEQFEAIRRDMVTDPKTFQRSFGASREWALSLLMAGSHEEALMVLKEAETRVRERYGPRHYVAAEVEGMMGMACVSLGREKEAEALFERAVPLLLHQWRDKDGESLNQFGRSPRLAMIVGAYLDLLVSSADPNKALNALAVASALQSQFVARSLASSAARFSVGSPDLMALIRKRQDLELKMATVQNRLTRLLQAPMPLQNPDVKRRLFLETEALRLAIEGLDGVIRQRFPDYDAIVNPGMIPAERIRETLRPGEALICVFTGGESTTVWALPKQGAVCVHSSDAGDARLSAVVARLREALDPKGIRTLGDIPRYDLETAHSLYRLLLRPVEGGWKNATDLLVVTPGPLGQIPLAILPAAPTEQLPEKGVLFSSYKTVPWLIRSHSVTVLPSVAALLTVRSMPPGKKDRKAFAGFGDPWFSERQRAAVEASPPPSPGIPMEANMRSIRVVQHGTLDDPLLSHAGLEMLAPLPDTAEEVRSIARTLGADFERDVFLGAEADEGRVKGLFLADRRVLVFATHGLIPGDLDGLDQPALAMSSPRVTGNTEDDGLLTMGEVMGLELDADLVVLSACNTAAGNGSGAEAISGLGQGFFYAGARSLLVTAWPVETTSARALTTDFFKRLAGPSGIRRAEALRQTALEIIDTPTGQPFCYAHPIFWAPFLLVGDGG